MPNTYDLSGKPLANISSKKVAAGQTTANISVSGNATAGTDYISHLIITAASTAAPGAVTLLDGTTSVLVHQFVAATMTDLTQTLNVDLIATSTKGFNITTGTSVSCVAVGRF